MTDTSPQTDATVPDKGTNNPAPTPKLSMKSLNDRIDEQQAQIDTVEAVVRLLLEELNARQIVGGATIKSMTKVLNARLLNEEGGA